ncbi:cell division control protein 14, SIN component-domain-containing protein [Melampsora americana]|nr:cell division control protein 14, SIN component-domain-containing protein [Melampsora americana]
MNKSIINQSSIQSQSHLLSTYDNLLNSTIKSSHHQLKISHQSLNIIKEFLIHFTLGPDHQKKDAIEFIRLQSELQLNSTMILIRWISQISDRILSPDPHQIDSELLHQFVLALNLIQGLLHLHPPSQKLFSSQFNLQILLQFLSPALEIHELQSITIPLLDLLLTTFIDSSFNKQLFESSGGLEILIKAMKNRQIKKEFRVKVLETVWGWWIDEELDDENDEKDENLISKQSKINPFQPQNTFTPSSTTSTPSRSTPHQSERKGRIINRNDENSKATPGNSRLRPISLPPPSITTTMVDNNDFETADKETPRARKMSTPIHTPRQESHRLREIGQGHSRVQSSDRKLGSSNMIKSSSTSSPMIKPSSLSTSSPMMKSSSLSNGLPSPMLKSTSSGLPGTATPVMKSSSGLPGTPNSAKPSSSTPIAPRSSGDPSTRLRQMLENTASDFVPATPQHNRIKLTQTPRRAYGLNKSQPATSRNRHHLSSESDDIPEESDEDQQGTPTKLFPKGEKPGSGLNSKNLSSRRAGGINTPQRMLRHKQSASLGSIQFQSSKARVESDEDHESSKRSPHVHRREVREERFWSGDSSGDDQERKNRNEKRRSRTDLPLTTDRINLRERHSSSETMNHDPTLSHDEEPKLDRTAGEGRRRLRRSRGSIDGVKLNAVLSNPTTSRPVTPNSSSSRPITPISRPMTPTSIDQTQTKSTPLNKKTFLTKPNQTTSIHGTPIHQKVNKKDIEMMINEESEIYERLSPHQTESSLMKKNETLEKYMGNSEQLLKRFEEMKIGLNLMMIQN